MGDRAVTRSPLHAKRQLRLNARRARGIAPFFHLRLRKGAHFFRRIGDNLSAECLVALHHAWYLKRGAD
jgi:hypothetical protein